MPPWRDPFREPSGRRKCAVNQLVIVRLDEQRYALPLQEVERVVRMVEISEVPEAPAAILGLINVQGEVLSVFDLRGCLGLPVREISPEDVLVIVRTAGGKVALAADGVEVMGDWPRQTTVSREKIHSPPSYLEGVVKLAEGLLFICDLDRLLAIGAAPPPFKAAEPAALNRLNTQMTSKRERKQRERKLEGPTPPPARAEGEGAAQRKKLLRERAHLLAREPAAEESDERLEVVVFLLGRERYGIETSLIREVLTLREPTPLPCTPSFVLGIMNLRGEIISVLDLRKIFGFGELEPAELNKVIVLRGAALEFGILADEVIGVRTIPAKGVHPSPTTLTGMRADYLKGVVGGRLVLLDAGKMLADRRLVVHQEV